MNFQDNNITYTIPLDVIDLNYITKVTRPNKVSPLWDLKDNIKGYYEFKLFAQHKGETVPEDLNDEANHTHLRRHRTRRKRTRSRKGRMLEIPPVVAVRLSRKVVVPADKALYKEDDIPPATYSCTVCNLDIPILYMKEHIKSTKHKTCVKIIEVALDRAKNCLIPPEGDIDVKPIARSFFCEPCVIVVKELNRDQHELSKNHFKSLMHDQFLNDLLQIFINKEHLEKVDFDYMTKEHFSSTTSDSSDESLNDNDGIVNECATPDVVAKTTLDMKQALEIVTRNEHNVKTLEGYLKMINDCSKLSPCPIITTHGDRVRIETIDKYILSVPEDHFHGFARIDKWSSCRLCLKAVNAEEESHKMSYEHISKLLTPIQDMHGIRYINPVINHCVLCNINFSDLHLHKRTSTHKAVLQEGIERVLQNPNDRQNKTYCEACDAHVMTYNYNSHTTEKVHLSNAAILAEKTKINNPKAIFTGILHHHLKIDKGIVTCEVCNIEIDAIRVNEHIKGSHHSAKLKSLLANNGINYMNGNLLFCDACKYVIDDKREIVHINSEQHIRKLSGESKVTSQMYDCKICNMQVPNSKGNVDKHESCHKVLRMGKLTQK